MRIQNMNKKQLGYFEGILSSVLNTILFGFKMWVGTAAGSVAMTADAWHTLSDTLTSLVVIVGFWISSRPGDDEHPFGHGRAELVASIVIGTLLAVVGFNFFLDSIAQLRDHKSVTFGPAAFVVFSISVILKEGIARFSMWAGRKVKSQSLIADGWHHRSDAIASLLIIVGALFGSWFWWIDGVLGLGVSLLILYAAYQIIKDATNSLLGESADPEMTERIRLIAQECSPLSSDIHHLHLHRYGDHIEVTLHARLPEDMPLNAAHEYSSLLETRLKKDLDMEATIHLEPKKR